jgi:phospholipid transport system substrate-binding protein
MNTLKFYLRNYFVMTLLMMSLSGNAWCAEDPYQKIELVTVELLHIIGAHQQGYPENDQQYFNALSELLNDTVAFKYIAKKVMGPFYPKASPQQRDLFLQKFRQGLVETYARGLINYGDQQIVLVDRKPLQLGQRTLIVKQEIRSGGKIYPLQYSMARKKTGKWLVINMTISGINLREIFRSQFIQAARRSSGDLDAVIAEWTAESN